MDNRRNALLRAGLLNPKADRVRSPLFVRLPFFDPHDKLQVKYEMLRGHAVDGVPILQVAGQFGYSRQGFYQLQDAFRADGMAGLLEKKRGRKGPLRCTPEVVGRVLAQKQAHPDLAGRDLAEWMEREHGIRVHRRTVEKIVSGLRPSSRKKKPPAQK